MFTKNLDFSITLHEETFTLTVTEPESGEVSHFNHPYSPDEHPVFDEVVGNEIYSWIMLWKDIEN